MIVQDGVYFYYTNLLLNKNITKNRLKGQLLDVF